MKLPKRKNIRLRGYDYSSYGAYFITICTKNKECLFWNSVGARIARPQNSVSLSDYGLAVKNAIESINDIHKCFIVEKYCIMPNHIHMILTITEPVMNSKTDYIQSIGTVINQFKGYVTKQIGFSPWQKLFYDHIIRNENDFNEIWDYIDLNPAKWESDRFWYNELPLNKNDE